MSAPTPRDPAPKPITIFSGLCAFRRDGFPVLGNMGSTHRPVIVIPGDEWKRLTDAIPELGTTHFRVGEL